MALRVGELLERALTPQPGVLADELADEVVVLGVAVAVAVAVEIAADEVLQVRQQPLDGGLADLAAVVHHEQGEV